MVEGNADTIKKEKEEKEWSKYYRFEVRDPEGVLIDSDLVRGSKAAIGRVKISGKRVDEARLSVYDINGEIIFSAS